MDEKDEKKIIDVLMDDDTFIVKKGKEKDEEEKRIREVEERKEEVTEKEREAGIEGKGEVKETKGKSESEKAETTGKTEVKTEEREKVGSLPLSEIERSVLRSVVFESKEPRVIARLTGYPEVVVKKALERLIDKGYLSYELEPTEKVSEVKWLRATKVSVKYGKSTRMAVIDAAIAVAAFMFLLSLLYYFGILKV